MANQEIKGEDYVVHYNADAVTVRFQGELALRSPQEYAPIKDLLYDVASDSPAVITIDLRQLAFLNSSGISMLSKFVLGLRKNKDIQLAILGSHDVPWQGKSLRNLQKFLPSLRLEVE
jgi:hypothetical protein